MLFAVESDTENYRNFCTLKLFTKGHLPIVIDPKQVFINLTKTATILVEFSFNKIMFRQINGIACGVVGSITANIFFGYHKPNLFNKIFKPIVYLCYKDAVFFFFHEPNDLEKNLNSFNLLMPYLKFTNEIKVNNYLTFFEPTCY